MVTVLIVVYITIGVVIMAIAALAIITLGANYLDYLKLLLGVLIWPVLIAISIIKTLVR